MNEETKNKLDDQSFTPKEGSSRTIDEHCGEPEGTFNQIRERLGLAPYYRALESKPADSPTPAGEEALKLHKHGPCVLCKGADQDSEFDYCRACGFTVLTISDIREKGFGYETNLGRTVRLAKGHQGPPEKPIQFGVQESERLADKIVSALSELPGNSSHFDRCEVVENIIQREIQ